MIAIASIWVGWGIAAMSGVLDSAGVVAVAVIACIATIVAATN